MIPDFKSDEAHLALYCGQEFKAPYNGNTYQWRAGAVVDHMNTGKPFILAWPKWKVTGKSHVIDHCVGFHLEEMPPL